MHYLATLMALVACHRLWSDDVHARLVSSHHTGPSTLKHMYGAEISHGVSCEPGFAFVQFVKPLFCVVMSDAFYFLEILQ